MKEILFIFALLPLVVTGSSQDEQSLERLSQMFLGFLAVADVKRENALLMDDQSDNKDNGNDKATQRNNRNRRRNNERQRKGNRPSRTPRRTSSSPRIKRERDM